MSQQTFLRWPSVAITAVLATGGRMGNAQVIPKAPQPAKTLVAVDIYPRPREEQFLIAALQGLVNRRQPRIYVQDDRYEGGKDAQLHENMKDWWRADLERRGYRFQNEPDALALVARFKNAYRGAILYEPECWTNPDRANNLNVVATLCGVDDLLPVTPELNARLHLPVKRDVRGLWRGPIEAYQWALKEPTIRAKASRRLAAHSHPWSLFMMDYIIQNRALAFWMTKGAFGAERDRLYTELVTFAAPNTPVMGAWQSWWPKSPLGSAVEGLDELTTVKFVSDYGRFFIPVVSGGNFSVHSGLPPARLKQQRTAFRILEKDKVYVTFVLSDGDNVSGFMLIRPLLWKDPARGRIPIGWNFSPAMAGLAPNVLDWFYRTATPNDYFVTACSGLGYVFAGYGAKAREGMDLLDGYLALTRRAMKATDSRETWNWWMDAATAGRFVRGLPELNGLFLEPEPRQDAYEESFHAFPGLDGKEMPAFHNFGSAGTGLGSEADRETWRKFVTDKVGSRRPAFVFLGFNGFQAEPSNLDKMLKLLGPDYVAVRPDEFVHLYREHRNLQGAGSKEAASKSHPY